MIHEKINEFQKAIKAKCEGKPAKPTKANA